jgi:two-component SAPR family response regulator
MSDVKDQTMLAECQGWRLLVLEDDANLRQVLHDVLSDEGYQVTAASTGAEAVELASHQTFDLIITDIRMDGVDGLQALERARSFLPEVSSLVVSGYTTEAETLRALQLNVGGYLKKPFALADFLQKTRELLSQRKQQREQAERFQSLRSSLWWSLESRGGIDLEAGRRAVYLAQKLGLSPEQTQVTRLATGLFSNASTLQWPSHALRDQAGLGPIQQLYLEARAFSQGQPLRLEAQILLVATFLDADQDLPDRFQGFEPGLLLSVRELREASQQQISAAVIAQEQSLGFASQAKLQRSLLGLALTLEERKELKTAEQAFSNLADSPGLAPEMLQQALVGLARIGWKRQALEKDATGQSDGSPQCWYERLKEAELVSRQLGPRIGAAQRWPIALLLLRSGHTSAASYLASLEKEYLDLGLAVPAAKCRILHDRSGTAALQAALKSLLSTPAVGEVAQDVEVILPAMLELAGSACSHLAQAAAWCRLLCEFGHAAENWASQTPCSAAIAYLLDCCQASPELAPVGFLQACCLRQESDIKSRASALVAQREGRATHFLRFRCFGHFEVTVDGQKISDSDWKTQKFKFLLAYLVTRTLGSSGQSLNEDVLLEEFWPESRGGSKTNLYSATKVIRKCLRMAAKDSDCEFVLREKDGLRFDASLPRWCDLEQFESALASEDLDVLRSAAELVRGAFLEGCYLDWAQRRRNQLEEQSLQLFSKLAQRLVEQNPLEAADYAQRGLEIDPLLQECHLFKMQAYLAAQQPERALKQFQVCERELKRELGIEPLTSLVECFYRAKLALA